jgi:predicted DNA-binding antitoxin AbrB/MazE fold protein
MREIITAIYQNGTLHLLQPLNLQEHQTVQLQLLESAPITDSSNLLEQLRDSGLVTITTAAPANALSDQALAAFVQTLPTTTIPTSQIIIEERGEW